MIANKLIKKNRIRFHYSMYKSLSSVKHYRLNRSRKHSLNPLSEFIKIEHNRGYNRSITKLLLRTRFFSKWNKSILTGLKPTKHKHRYYGDVPVIINGYRNPRHLLIFWFNESRAELVVDYYPNYYPKFESELKDYLKNV